MATLLCGYIVVRRPEYAEGPNFQKTPEIEGRVYQGVDRLPWEDIDAASFEKHLNSTVIQDYKEIRNGPAGQRGIPLTPDLDTAVSLLKWSGERENEILGISCEYLAAMTGEVKTTKPLAYRGIDVISLAEWSLNRVGLFWRPDLFGESIKRCNCFGLFEKEADGKYLAQRYIALSENEEVEPLQSSPIIELVRVFSVNV